MSAGTSNLLRVPRILWGALYASTFVYLFVYFSRPAPASPGGSLETMHIALGVAALGCAVASFLLPARFHAMGAAAAKLAVEEVPDPDGSVMFRDKAPTVRVFADPGQARKKAMALYFTPLVLSLALTEAIAIYGLVLGFLGAEPVAVLPFFIAAWILFIPRFPRWRSAIEPLEKAHDARLVEGSSPGSVGSLRP